MPNITQPSSFNYRRGSAYTSNGCVEFLPSLQIKELNFSGKTKIS